MYIYRLVLLLVVGIYLFSPAIMDWWIDATAHSTARVLAPNLVTNTSPRADFAVAVAQWPEVVACYAMTGEMDYLLRVHVEDMEHFSRFMMATLLRHPAVLDVKSSFALQRIKDTTALPLL